MLVSLRKTPRPLSLCISRCTAHCSTFGLKRHTSSKANPEDLCNSSRSSSFSAQSCTRNPLGKAGPEANHLQSSCSTCTRPVDNLPKTSEMEVSKDSVPRLGSTSMMG